MSPEHAPEAAAPPIIQEDAEATLPTRFGDFRIYAFRDGRNGEEYGAVARGVLRGARGLPVRLHSECFTGDVMGSLRCDCRDQLEAALSYVGGSEAGLILYLRRHEGRGIGLVNKVRAYALQERGLDTVSANHALGFPDDLRDYEVAAAILHHLGVESVRLLTNNPRKQEGLERHGVPVEGLIPLRATANPHNQGYLATKRDRSGHLL